MRPWSTVTAPALVFSMLVHLLVAWSIFQNVSSLPVLRHEEQALSVELVEPPEPRPVKQEIAPPSQAKESPVAPPDARPGEKNTKTEKEMIQRGEDGERSKQPVEKGISRKAASAQQKIQQPAPPAPPTKAARGSGGARLTLGESELLARLGDGKLDPRGRPEDDSAAGEQQGKNVRPDAKPREMKLLSVEPFQRNFSPNSLHPGVSDLLHNIPDGEITLLNEKADRFAVFVRRVALQVFGVLRRSGWGTLPYPEVRAITKFARIRAIMSPKGKFIRAEALDGSGSFLFDDLLREAVERGVADQNPPKEAVATDGNFHFIFLARTWARLVPNATPEQRWMILGTGLE